ncbi:AAA family ATPase [Candidatus Peregrinibacteria bacterium]|nr:AAA family ATPase [Candidatus Peregrinibacteria bacterium]
MNSIWHSGQIKVNYLMLMNMELLNQEQKQAVTDIDGPMLVIAGAGTGKTRVITSRIIYLMLEKKVEPESILALTFTEKATEEMTTRIDEEMPLSYEEPVIKTIHSFCDSILREKAHEIGIDNNYRLLSQGEQWLFLKQNLYNFDLDYYRPLGNPNKFINILLSHFSRLKDEDIGPTAYVEYAEIQNTNAGSDEEKEEAAKRLEVARAYATYQKIMMANNFMDFNDLQFYALRLLEKRSSVLKDFQERFKYLLVDEFQDTNLAQTKLIMLLAKKHSNIMVVGDDDQSIYKWRGASLSNIKTFQKFFPDAKKVVLNQNYRSCQPILDISYEVIKNNNPYRLEVEAGVDKKLFSNTDCEDTSPVEVVEFENYIDEIEYIKNQIKALADKGVEYRDMSILIRTNQIGQMFADALRLSNIPFVIKDNGGLLKDSIIKDLIAFLRFVKKPHDDVATVRILTQEAFGLEMSDILNLVQQAKSSHFKPIFYFLRDNLNIEGNEFFPETKFINKFNEVYILMNELLEFARTHSLSRLVGEFLDKSGIHKNLTKNDTLENAEKIESIAKFLNVVNDFELNNSETSINDFIDYLDSMDEVPGNPFGRKPQLEADAVSILTVHSAKGLEFDHVFIPSLVKHRFPGIKKSDPIVIPSELVNEDLPDKDMHLQEERRLFYVAITRARKKLSLTFSQFYEGKKQWKVSPFIEEVVNQNSHKVLLKDKTTATEPKKVMNLFEAENENSKTNYTPEVNINSLSFSKMDTFLTCPLKYKFRYLFQIPTPQPHAANFGSSIHNTVNQFYSEIKKGHSPSLERLKQIFEENWIPQGYENKGHEKARKIQGTHIMERFFEKEKESDFKPPEFLERSFRVKIGNVTFSGRIDRIDKLEDGTYEIIDYKTGKSKLNANLKKDLQLSLYAYAAKELYKLPVSRLSLYYLDDVSKASTERNEDDLKEFKELMLEHCKNLKNSSFEASPGYQCSYCEFRTLCHAAI